MKRWLALMLLALAVASGWAKEAAPLADDPVVEQRLIAISEEMRCLVCQQVKMEVDRSNLVPLFQLAIHQVTSNEATCTGDQDFHA